MLLINDYSKWNIFLCIPALVAFSTIFLACNVGSTSSDDTVIASPDTGSVLFRAAWPKNGPSDNALYQIQSPSNDVCVEHGIETVIIEVYDATNTPIITQSRFCTEHSATISNVTAGSKMWLTLSGMVSGSVQWKGQSNVFNLPANAIADLGRITVNFIGDDTQSPNVETTLPANGSDHVSLNTTITAKLSETVISGLAVSAFHLITGTTSVNGSIEYDPDNRTIIFTPESDLMEGTKYTASITGTIEDLAGNRMNNNYVWDFTTTAKTAPTVTTLEATETTKDTARLNAIVNPNNLPTTYHFEYGTDLSATAITTMSQTTGSEHNPIPVFAVVRDLDPGTQYHYRIVATNSDGTTIGSNGTFTTNAVWAKTVLRGHSGFHFSNLIQQTLDAGYIVSSNVAEGILLIKLNANGNVAWKKTYGSAEYNSVGSILQTTDGGYMVTGKTGLRNDEILLTKMDEDGTFAWGSTYGTANPYFTKDLNIQRTMDGGYMVSGTILIRDADPSETYDIFLLKLSSNAQVAWSNSYGSGKDEYTLNALQTADRGYIILGYSTGDDASSYLLKLDANAEIVWQKAYGSRELYELSAVSQTSDGGYISVGSANQSGNQYINDILLLKLYADGEVEWRATYGGIRNDHGTSVLQTREGKYIIAGTTNSFPSDSSHSNIWVLKLDTDGAVLWQRSYGGDHDESARSILQTLDGGYVVGGSTGTFADPSNQSSFNTWVLKIDQKGSLGCDLDSITNVEVASGPQIIPEPADFVATGRSFAITNLTFEEQNAPVIVSSQCPLPSSIHSK